MPERRPAEAKILSRDALHPLVAFGVVDDDGAAGRPQPRREGGVLEHDELSGVGEAAGDGAGEQRAATTAHDTADDAVIGDGAREALGDQLELCGQLTGRGQERNQLADHLRRTLVVTAGVLCRANRLRRVHSAVGDLDEIDDRARLFGEDGESGAHLHANHGSSERVGDGLRFEPREQCLDVALGRLAVGAAQDDEELIATVAADLPTRRQRASRRRRGGRRRRKGGRRCRSRPSSGRHRPSPRRRTPARGR